MMLFSAKEQHDAISLHSIERQMHVRLLSVAGLVAVLRPETGREISSGASPAFASARFDSYIKAHVKLTADEYKQLLAGQPVTQRLEADPAKEVAILAHLGQCTDGSIRQRREGHRVV